MYMYIGTMTDISKVADQYTSAQQATSVEQGKKGPDILDGDYARTDPDDYAHVSVDGKVRAKPKGPRTEHVQLAVPRLGQEPSRAHRQNS